MATNGGNNVEDADMAECDGEKVVTMMDVLQEQQDFEDDANAVLGASDEKNCTYSKGYIKRQAIYACLTCCSEAKNNPTQRAGVCLACSLNCHENHDLIELYTKRNFRCDCGNPKFNSHPCQFTPDKTDLNEDNKYNQNFSGLYCNCHRPYPDPESTVEDDEMIQCIICEDWLHASHLDAVVPGNDQYSEMVCKACMESNEFLHDYSFLAVNIEMGDVDITTVNGTNTEITNSDLDVEKSVNSTGDSTEDIIEKPANDMDVNGAHTENQDLQKPNEESETDINIKVEKTENASHIFSEVSSETKNDASTAITSKDKTDPKETEDKLKGQTSEDKEGVAPQQSEETPLENAVKTEAIPEPEETKEAEEKIEQDRPQSVNLEENSENSISTGQTTEITPEDSNGADLIKIETKDSDEKNTIQSTTENDDSSVDIKPNDIDMNEVNVEETENSDVAKDENSTNKTDSTETDKSLNNITSEAVINDSISKVVPNEISNNVNTNEPCVTKTEVSNEIVNGTADIKATTEFQDNKRKLSTEEDTDDNLVKKPKLAEESSCTRPKHVKRFHKGATFWTSTFRQKLCTCNECLSMYKDLSVLFLLDPEDTVIAYETLGKEMVDGRATQYEKGLAALSSLDRIQQINALTEYNKMKDKLLDFLKSFKDRKEVVKEEDIKAFFAGMKPKREPDGVYFCR